MNMNRLYYCSLFVLNVCIFCFVFSIFISCRLIIDFNVSISNRFPFEFQSAGIGEPSVYHALVVIFLEFFAWGLLTMPVITVSQTSQFLYFYNLLWILSILQVLNHTFPDHTFLMNGLVMGIKGILSFLSAPLIGALSDVWGRKFFLLITVFFTCAPIPLMTINTW